MKICVCQFISRDSTSKVIHVDRIIDFEIASVSRWEEGCLISNGKGEMYRRTAMFEELNSIHGWEKHP